MDDRFYVRYFNKNTKEFEYHKIGAINTKPYTDCTIYEEGQFCTGLHDKNGKFIYEGDIVRGKDHFDRDRKCIVRYSETYCCYFIVGDGWSDEYMFNLNDKEVIGNIYTDAHLLEEYKDENRNRNKKPFS